MNQDFKVLFLLLVLSMLPISKLSAEITFNKDIAPIMFKNCSGCHREGEIGPFPLLTYEDAAKRAEFIADQVAERSMPPWKAEPHYGHFMGERRLSDQEIELFQTWAKTGSKEGNPQDLPKSPQFTSGWHLGEPDLIVKMPEKFEIYADGEDIYRCFTIPLNIAENKTVSAIEFRPGNPKVVHHAILFLDSMGQGRKKEKADGLPGFKSFGGPGIIPTGGLGAWVPGSVPEHLPQGTGRFLRKGSDLVVQIHYHPTGKTETDQSTIGIYFTKEPAKKIVAGLAIRSRKLYIPPGAKRHHIEAESEPLPCDVEAVTVSPHMHLVGEEMKVYAITPDKTEIPLVWIKQWDFNWQGAYQFTSPVKIPKGSVVKLDAYYNNSTDNPFNPNSPPKAIRWGEETSDEMCLCGLAVITDNKADLLKIASMTFAQLGAGIGGGIPEEDDAGARWRKFIPKNGIKIPEKYKESLKEFDTDGSETIDEQEVDAMPAQFRQKVAEKIVEYIDRQNN
jgi:hypothetical protein